MLPVENYADEWNFQALLNSRPSEFLQELEIPVISNFISTS